MDYCCYLFIDFMNHMMGFFLVVSILVATVLCGCSSSNQSLPTVTSPGIPESTAIIPVSMSTMSSSEDINAIQSQFTRIWRRVQVAYDNFTEERDTLDLSINDDINYLRQQIIPGTISDYKAIITELASINVSDPDLQKEKKVLVSICEYKIKLLEGLSAAYHAPQIEEYDLKKSLEEYKNAKYFFQDVLDIINVQGIGVSQYPEEKEPPYARKYWDYIYSDRETAKAYFKWANNNISRVAGLI